MKKPILAEPVLETLTMHEAPALTEISMSVKVTIPLLQYGNIEMFVSQKAVVHDTPEARETATLEGLNRLKRHVAEIVLPLVEAEVQRGLPELLKQSNPDTWMQIKNPTYRWLRVAQPDMTIPAMEAIIMDEERIALVKK